MIESGWDVLLFACLVADIGAVLLFIGCLAHELLKAPERRATRY